MSFDNLENFLSGTVDGGFQYSGDSNRNTFENGFGIYAQDSFRVTRRLTLNYGLRWDYFGVVGEKNNLLSNITALDSVAQTFTLTRVGQAGLSSLYNPDKKNFAPRVNLAWDVRGKGKTVVRGGFGIFFDAFSQDMVLGHLPYAPYFDPGPAYNPLPGVKPIYSAGVTGSISPGVPVFGDETACNYECDAFAFDRNIKTPYMENYNLNIQQQITNKVVLQMGYVGSQGHRLWRFFDINQPNAQAIHDAQCPRAPGTAPGSDCSATLGARALEFTAPGVFSGAPTGTFYIFQENSTGKSNYNSLQASLRVNAWHGVTSFVNFVWSRSMDNSSDGEDFVPNAAQPADSTNPNNEY